MLEREELWTGVDPSTRHRLRAVTYNNIGCLCKRSNHAQLALQVRRGGGWGRARSGGVT